jgi:hypothetical protein
VVCRNNHSKEQRGRIVAGAVCLRR